MDELQAQKVSEREWWDRKKANIHTEFMKELDEGSVTGPTTKKAPAAASRVSDDDAVLVEAGGPADKPQGSEGKKKKGRK